MKKYLAFDASNCEYEEFATIEEARAYLKEGFLDDVEGYSPDTEDCKIFEVIETVKLTEIDKKSNYKYESEDAAEAEGDQEALDNEDYWPNPNCFDIVSEHEFVKVAL